MTAPTLARFLYTVEGCVRAEPYETGNNLTRFGVEREEHYPGMIHTSNGDPFPLTWGTDWCSIFAGYCYHTAAGWPAEWQLPAPMFFTPQDVNAWRAAGMWEGDPAQGQPGDFIFFDWPSDADRLANHVGIVVDTITSLLSGATLGYWVVEGNVGTPSWYVRRTRYTVGPDILGFGRPTYASEPPTKTTHDGDTDMVLILDTTHDAIYALQPDGKRRHLGLDEWLIRQDAGATLEGLVKRTAAELDPIPVA